MNHPAFGWGASVIVVELLDGFGGEVVEVLVGAFGVEPHDPFGGRQFDLLDGAPRLSGFDQLGFVQPVDRLGQCVIPRRQLRLIRSVISELFG